MTTYQEISAQFYSNRLLFGDPADPGVVAVEIASKTEIDVYRRLSGRLARERRPIQSFLLVEDLALLEAFRPVHETRALEAISVTGCSSPSARSTLWKPPSAISGT